MTENTAEKLATNHQPLTSEGLERLIFHASAADFKKIPGSPIAYWVSENILRSFDQEKLIGDIAQVKIGMGTGKNEVFVREWWEVNHPQINFSLKNVNELVDSNGRYFPYNKGGDYRLWHGNLQQVLWFDSAGRDYMNTMSGHRENGGWNYYFRQGLTWSFISSSKFGVRLLPYGFAFDVAGSMLFFDDKEIKYVLGFLSSVVCFDILSLLNPTLNYQAGNIKSLPIKLSTDRHGEVTEIVECNISLSRVDWDAYETSWDFKSLPLLDFRFGKSDRGLENNQKSSIINHQLSEAYAKLRAHWQSMTAEMQRLEKENNRIFIDAYGLQDELTPDVPMEEITLTCNPVYRYGGGKTDEAYERLQRTDTMKELISYASGCMMGRYSLDTTGLQFAGGEYDHAEACRNAPSFPPDADGILPVLSDAYFEEDATGRFMTFLATAFGRESLTQNAQFLANALGARSNESPQATIRRYLADTFFKDHLRTYKKRPIYWLFSSGKLKAFQALVYMHRYTPSTLARMRTNYLHALQNKLRARIDDLEGAAESAGTKTDRNLSRLRKQLEELRQFDEKLHHFADQRIAIDLDDGVKHNYGRFGDLLVEVKFITGTTQNDS